MNARSLFRQEEPRAENKVRVGATGAHECDMLAGWLGVLLSEAAVGVFLGPAS